MIKNDNIPYIIVDNRKIPPLSRGDRPHAARARSPQSTEVPFGVVDRVTISSAAKLRSMQYRLLAEASSVVPQVADSAPLALTYDVRAHLSRK